ncbi:ArnT family glycosyltransferase [Burkholderia oklahomensis]|uniref:ArnT family glycosyltransferase n=1 Tax=Burkholderia oklahomensis TaxID=342113 RepID=UPI00016AA1AE|nr:glycosyl transferase [Burkholderia oklahomensis]AJX30557.1 putative membrane protein [Burkholderia oklahomensis C6786]AOI46598.1 glycosyl transferase [Burkholderia oklahomensis C6786]KUY62774.1 glycosyl transferase [Burkholderia oklahomensis C6786]MBI0360778.1 glycosyl transferase [Burkholderia oklahomensis]SUW60153.1 4-amino-4-deoxy-L-arabinose transferase [Burkholderia oklahomensis]
MQGNATPGGRHAPAPGSAHHVRPSEANSPTSSAATLAVPASSAAGAAGGRAADAREASVARAPLAGLRAWLVAAAVLCAYLLPGALGHDPWKQDETYTFGIIQHMLESGDFVVPTNAGQPFLEKPPLYDWVATGLAWLFSRYLPLHDAARLASALFAALAFGFAARAARIATGATRWLELPVIGTVALYAGSLIVIKHSHDLMTDVALMAGTAMGFCGLLELVIRHAGGANGAIPTHRAPANRFAAPLFGLGVGIALMSKGLFVPLVFGATVAATLVLYPACRSRAFLRSLAVAALVCAPFALIWPTALFLRSESLFLVWFWENNVGRFFGFSVPTLGAENDKPLFIWRALLTVGFPVAPLALVALARGLWREWRAPRVALPLAFAGIGMVVLHISATSRQLYVLPFIAPLALVAAQAIPRLPQRLHTAWDYASRLLFGAVAALAWIVWSLMSDHNGPRAGLQWLGRWLPLDWTMPIEPALVLSALAITIGWVGLLPSLRLAGKWRGALSWAMGALVAWGLVYTLLLPWLDVAKSYRSVFEDLNRRLALEWNDGDCMASVDLGESEAPMLYYFSGIRHQPVALPDTSACTWLIVQGTRASPPALGGEWKPFWSGARPGDEQEMLRVYVRTPTPPAAHRLNP